MEEHWKVKNENKEKDNANSYIEGGNVAKIDNEIFKGIESNVNKNCNAKELDDKNVGIFEKSDPPAALAGNKILDVQVHVNKDSTNEIEDKASASDYNIRKEPKFSRNFGYSNFNQRN